jgi:hypothetical protein
MRAQDRDLILRNVSIELELGHSLWIPAAKYDFNIYDRAPSE